MGDAEPEEPLPETLLGSTPSRVRLDRMGSPVRYAILGSPADFESARAERIAASQAEGSPYDASSLAFLQLAHGSAAGGSAMWAAPERASTAASRLRRVATASAWASAAERESIRQQRFLDRSRFYARAHRRNEEQAERATGKASIMHLVDEHRDKVLAKQDAAEQRETGEALPSAWTIQLRDAGQEIVRIGALINGLYVIKKQTEAKVQKRPPPAALAAAAAAARSSASLFSELDYGDDGGTMAAELDAGAGAAGGGARAGGNGQQPVASVEEAALAGSINSRAESAPPGLRMHGTGGSTLLPPLRPTAARPALSAGEHGGGAGVMRPSTATAYVRSALSATASAPAPASDGAPAPAVPAARGSPTIAIELSSTQLALDAPVGETRDATVTMRNTGSAAVHFTWRRVPAEQQHALHAALPTRADVARFYVSPMQAALTPGSTIVVTFSFATRVSGRFSEAFELLMAPDGSASAANADVADAVPSAVHLHRPQPPTVRLVALSTEPLNATAVGRRRVQATIAHAVLHGMMVDILVADVLARIPLPPAPSAAPLGGLSLIHI